MPTFSRRSWAVLWKARVRGSSGLLRWRVRPAILMVPESMTSRQLRHLRNVDLPQPEGPIIETRSPSATFTETLRRTGPSPKPLFKLVTEMSGVSCCGVLDISTGHENYEITEARSEPFVENNDTLLKNRI